MINLTSQLISFLVIFPIITLFIVFVISKLITKKHRFSIHLALDISTFFFILSVHFLIQSIWNTSLFIYIIIFILLIGMIFVIIHWKLKEEMEYKKIFKGIWRITFLLFFTLYVVLLIYGLVRSILKALGMV
ncbi:DUF3397 domain-containing protein [Niallia sp. FSL W8-0635]|uniref:DUF3397 domain-containing protein n=1 Tax=Niallia sp. FSL W8-0635 TaxID=2975337 RepID=UPI0009CD775E|nr:Protein of uncharacterised function (DUF3397) [Mycobacteroides abscessus subsp. abscessus]HEO8420722.1 DUF3397 domain-containing protein [Yersinia enterocolitica]